MLAHPSWCDQASFDLRCWCEGRCGQESEGGIVRAAAPGVRVRHRHGEGCGADSSAFIAGWCARRWRAPCRRCVAIARAPSRPWDRWRRSSMPILAADATAPRKQRHTARRIHRRILAELPGWPVAESTVRNHVRERRRVLGMEARADLRAAILRLGLGGSGRLVRGAGRSRRRPGQAAGVLHAQHGERGGVPPGLPACHAAGVPRGARARLRLLRRGPSGSCATTT